MTYKYIASPYTHDDPSVMEDRHMKVEAFCAHILKKGVTVFSPIVHCHNLANKHDLPKDYSFWCEYSLSMLRVASEMIVFCLPGWSKSRGVSDEIKFCKKAGIPIYYVVLLSNGEYLLSGGIARCKSISKLVSAE